MASRTAGFTGVEDDDDRRSRGSARLGSRMARREPPARGAARCSSMRVRKVRQLELPAVRRAERAPPLLRRPRRMEVRVDEMSARRQHARRLARSTRPDPRRRRPSATSRQIERPSANGRRQASPQTRGVVHGRRAAASPATDRGRRRDRAPADASSGRYRPVPVPTSSARRGAAAARIGATICLLGLHQRVVRTRRIGLGPQRVALARRQHARRCPCRKPASPRIVIIRTPSSPAAGSGSAAAAPAARTAPRRSAARTASALTARSSARRAGVRRRSVTVG